MKREATPRRATGPDRIELITGDNSPTIHLTVSELHGDLSPVIGSPSGTSVSTVIARQLLWGISVARTAGWFP